MSRYATALLCRSPSGNNALEGVSSYAVFGVQREPSSFAFESPLPSRGAPSNDDIDPELASLPAPRRPGRALALALHALAAITPVLFAFALRHDFAYAFSPATPLTVGDLQQVPLDALRSYRNRHVTADGLLGVSGGLRYERPFSRGTFRALPVLGRLDLWVEVRVPADEESGRWEPPRTFSGRLQSFDEAGPSHSGLRDALVSTGHAPVHPQAMLLVDGEAPADARWAVALTTICLGIALAHTAAVARIVRRVR